MNGDRVPLNRLAFGLLDFFGIKNQGRYTQHLLEDLQPVLDLDRLYKASAETLLRGQLAGIATGVAQFIVTSPVDMIVPDDQVWHVHSFSAQVTQGAAADVVNLSLSTRQEMGSYSTMGEAIGPNMEITASGINQVNSFGWDWSGQGRYFGPRTRFGLQGRVFSAGGNAAVTLQLRYTPLRF